MDSYCAGHGIPDFYARPPDTPAYAAGGSRAYPLPVAASTFAHESSPMDTQMDCKAFMRAHKGSAVSLYTYALGAASHTEAAHSPGLSVCVSTVRVRRVRRQYGREYYGGGDSNKASLFPL